MTCSISDQAAERHVFSLNTLTIAGLQSFRRGCTELTLERSQSCALRVLCIEALELCSSVIRDFHQQTFGGRPLSFRTRVCAGCGPDPPQSRPARRCALTMWRRLRLAHDIARAPRRMGADRRSARRRELTHGRTALKLARASRRSYVPRNPPCRLRPPIPCFSAPPSKAG
jgi:hypothetical protein